MSPVECAIVLRLSCANASLHTAAARNKILEVLAWSFNALSFPDGYISKSDYMLELRQ